VGRPLSTSQAAAVIGVRREIVRGLAVRGVIPSVRVGRHWRMRLEDVHAFKARRDAHPERQRSPVRSKPSEPLW
jgi:excisionase family DNA binding protein